MNDDNNLDLLDLDDNGSMDTLPEATPFASPRPKKPWLLLSIGLLVIILATYIIVRAIGDESSSSMEVDLDVPVAVVEGSGEPVDMNVMPPAEPVQVVPVQQPVVKVQTEQPKPVAEVKPVEATAGVPVRVVEERKEVKFEPAKAATKTTAQSKAIAAKPKTSASKPKATSVAKPAVKTQTAQPVAGSWYVQFASYSTRALAESGQRQLRNAHPSLFEGKQFTILGAQLKDGTTKYRLRIAFKTASDANGFCRNAKSDGLDCYVTK